MKYTNECIKLSHITLVRNGVEKNGTTRVTMLEITEEQEASLINNENVTITINDMIYTINPNLCYIYGEVDFSPNSAMLNEITKYNWFERYYVRHFIPSKYDYKTHTIVSNIKGGRWFDTDNIKTYLPFLYACIGKPKRVAIFKEELELLSILTRRLHQKEYIQRNRDKIRKKKAKIREHKTNNRIKALTINFKTNNK